MLSQDKFQGKAYMKRNYYVRSEVQKHNKFISGWVTLHGKVYDLTSLLNKHHRSPVTNSTTYNTQNTLDIRSPLKIPIIASSE